MQEILKKSKPSVDKRQKQNNLSWSFLQELILGFINVFPEDRREGAMLRGIHP